MSGTGPAGEQAHAAGGAGGTLSALTSGGDWNGYTTFERTGYYAQVEPQHFATALDWLVAIAARPAFSEATLAKERKVIFAEGWGQKSRLLAWLYAQPVGRECDL